MPHAREMPRSTSTSSPARPFRVLGVQQLAIGGERKADLRALWVELLGLEAVGSFRSERENVDEDILVCGAGPARVEIDLMEPIDPARSPKVHVPALNHVGLWIDDLPAAVAWLEGRGVRFTPGGIRPGAAGFDVCFIHPRGSDVAPEGGRGVLIELVQAPPALVEAFAALSHASTPGA
jgi:lactoylglutathione lyase